MKCVEKILGLWMSARSRVGIVGVGIVALAESVLVSPTMAGELRCEDGKCVIDSVFSLKLGSTEYAEILSDKETSYFRSDLILVDGMIETQTCSLVRLEQPLGSLEWAELYPCMKDMSLEHIEISSNGYGIERGLAYMERVAADIERRFGVTVWTRFASSILDIKQLGAELDSRRKKGELCCSEKVGRRDFTIEVNGQRWAGSIEIDTYGSCDVSFRAAADGASAEPDVGMGMDVDDLNGVEWTMDTLQTCHAACDWAVAEIIREKDVDAQVEFVLTDSRVKELLAQMKKDGERWKRYYFFKCQLLEPAKPWEIPRATYMEPDNGVTRAAPKDPPVVRKVVGSVTGSFGIGYGFQMKCQLNDNLPDRKEPGVAGKADGFVRQGGVK